ncbi:hypothetical protein K402DRAFT_417997 [Aulographum hederae CBS 113979]|uniref:Uncharacterized protein n=1 Tax=Aulographum hederae CBS 113979 TaxID=1176131 RepID=A0A6G1HA39_9PEZI|nr:hypothetical protein K402DRAFT_417997 [Aulographum hederae CBS 113979]
MSANHSISPTPTLTQQQTALAVTIGTQDENAHDLETVKASLEAMNADLDSVETDTDSIRTTLKSFNSHLDNKLFNAHLKKLEAGFGRGVEVLRRFSAAGEEKGKGKGKGEGEVEVEVQGKEGKGEGRSVWNDGGVGNGYEDPTEGSKKRKRGGA